MKHVTIKLSDTEKEKVRDFFNRLHSGDAEVHLGDDGKESIHGKLSPYLPPFNSGDKAGRDRHLHPNLIKAIVFQMDEEEILSKEVTDAIRAFKERTEAGEEVILVLENLPVSTNNNLGPTPSSHEEYMTSQHENYMTEFMQASFMEMAGSTPESFVDDHAFFNIIPDPQRTDIAYDPRSSSTSQGMHTDGANRAPEPHFTCLFARRNDEKAETCFIPSNNIVSQLDNETISTLKMPLFSHKGKTSEEGYNIGPFPLLEDEPPRISRFNDQLSIVSECVSDENKEAASNALTSLKQAMSNAESHNIILEEGDLGLFSNMVHYRGSFQANKTGDARWMVRASSGKPESANLAYGDEHGVPSSMLADAIFTSNAKSPQK